MNVSTELFPNSYFLVFQLCAIFKLNTKMGNDDIDDVITGIPT